MDIRFAESDERLTVAFCGDLDNASAVEAEKMLSPVFGRDDCDVLLDCQRLNYISSRGLRLLVTLYKHLRDNGHSGFVSHMNKNVREVLEVGGFLKLYSEVEG